MQGIYRILILGCGILVASCSLAFSAVLVEPPRYTQDSVSIHILESELKSYTFDFKVYAYHSTPIVVKKASKALFTDHPAGFAIFAYLASVSTKTVIMKPATESH